MKPEKPAPDQDTQLVQQAVDKLGEQFDSVTIFATRYESTQGGTIRIRISTGNIYASLGQIREWLDIEDEISRQRIRQNMANNS